MVNVNSFNQKVDLKKVADSFGFSDYQIINVPPYGSYLQTENFVGNVFDLCYQKFNCIHKSFEFLTDNKDFFKDKVPSHNIYFSNLYNSEYLKHMAWSSLTHNAMIALKEHRYNSEAEKYTLEEHCKEIGLNGINSNYFGHVTTELKNKYSKLFDWDREKYAAYTKAIILPYWHTPKHISKIVMFDLFKKFLPPVEIWKGAEQGWAGKQGKILSDFNELTVTEGCLWHPIQDYWNFKPVEISDNLGLFDLVRLLNSEKTVFVPGVAELLRTKGMIPALYKNLDRINREQVEKLQKELGLSDLVDAWKDINVGQYTIGGYTYLKKKDGYFMAFNGLVTRLTNFTVTLVKIERKRYILNIEQGDKMATVEVPTTTFNNCMKLKNVLRCQMSEHGFDLPQFYTDKADKKLEKFIFDYFNS